MSFILDALRKSDAERQRAASPGLADVRYATPPSRRSLWIPLLIVVMLANIGFMGWQLWSRPATEPPAAPAATPAAAAPLPPAAEIRPLAREAEPAEAMAEPEMDSDIPVAPVLMEGAEPEPAAAPTAAAAAKNYPRITQSTDLPTVDDLIAGGTLNVPALNLDLHVYSADPGGRFVVINSRKYKEGAELAEGPKVDVITPDGVILSHRGQRFTLARK